jgi:hypothetical protein
LFSIYGGEESITLNDMGVTIPRRSIVAMRSTIAIFAFVSLISTLWSEQSVAEDTEGPAIVRVSDAEVPAPVSDSSVPDEDELMPASSADVWDDVGSYEDGSSCSYYEANALCGRLYFGVEYLFWWNKNRNLPPLVTGGDPASVPFTAAGVLPAAPVVFGDEDVGGDLKSGGRLTGGLWLDKCQRFGAFVRAYGAEGDSTRFERASTGNPILAVPFNDRSAALFGQENALVLAYSGGVTAGIDAQGGVAAHASNDILGGDIFFRALALKGCNYRLDLLGGYQFTKIDDDLTFNTTLTRFDIAGNPQFSTRDLFDVSNEYHAGELGLLGEFCYGNLTFEILGKIGLGNMRQTVTIDGSYEIVTRGTTSGPGGLFAQTTTATGGPDFNMGHYQRDVFVWSPEANVKATYHVSDCLSVSVGYTFLYWTRVALAGDQVDRLVNRDVLFGGNFQPGGGPNPEFRFNDTDFWAQTIDLGLTLSY